MITASVKTSRTKIIGTMCVILAAIIALILFFGAESPANAAESISLRVTNNGERIKYLLSKGVETLEEPSLVSEVLLPEEMDDVLLKYNEVLLDSGFDISRYLGKSVKKYVYPVKNENEVFATLYIFDNRIIAADIASHTEGWQKAIDGGQNIG